MFADYHVHTEFSNDSTYSMDQAVKDAIAMKMDEICFTDHVDYRIKDDWNCGHSSQYRGKKLLANVDYLIYAAKALFQKYSFDFIILSIHQVVDNEFWTQDFQKGKSQEEYKRCYYEEMPNVVKQYSHNPEQLGTYIEDARQLLKSLGFRHFCTYDKMQPVYHNL